VEKREDYIAPMSQHPPLQLIQRWLMPWDFLGMDTNDILCEFDALICEFAAAGTIGPQFHPISCAVSFMWIAA